MMNADEVFKEIVESANIQNQSEYREFFKIVYGPFFFNNFSDETYE